MLLLLLGILLVAATAAFVSLLISYNLSAGPDYTVTLFGSHPFTVSTLGAFLGGIALTLIFGFGLWMMLAGGLFARHRHRKHRAVKHESRQAVSERDAMAGRLDEVERRQAETDSAGAGTRPAGSPGAAVRPGSGMYRGRRRTRTRRPHLPHFMHH